MHRTRSGWQARIVRSGLACAGVLGLWPTAQAVDRGEISDRPGIEGYEPSTLGYTNDNDDVSFVDFSLSLKYRLFPKLLDLPHERVYFAFTGRFGMYAGTRRSEPVIAKSYNPKLVWRHVMDHDDKVYQARSESGSALPDQLYGYLDVAYAHESNGQTISTPAELALAQSTAVRPEFAYDAMSRGWDYAQVVWKHTLIDTATRRVTSYTDFKYFISKGLLQDHIEEYNAWENNPEGKPRKAVNGVAATIEYEHEWQVSSGNKPWLANSRVSLRYETGYDSPFKYNTLRLEAGMHVLQLPLTLWMQRGYNSDLAQYYKKVTSYGVQLRMGGF